MWNEVFQACYQEDDGAIRIKAREDLAWVWAVLDADRQWGAFDGYWYERAQQAELTDDEAKDFAYVYQVARTITGGNYKKIADYANEHLLKPTTIEECTQAYREFCAFFVSKSLGSNGVPWVFAAKLTWFYQPNLWVMFDNNSVRAISPYVEHGKKGLIKENFQSDVRQIYNEDKVAIIKQMIGALGSSYLFPLRIIDKYLYLRGGDAFYRDYWIRKTEWIFRQSQKPPAYEAIKYASQLRA